MNPAAHTSMGILGISPESFGMSEVPILSRRAEFGLWYMPMPYNSENGGTGHLEELSKSISSV